MGDMPLARILVALACVAVLASCTIVEDVDFTPFLRDSGLQLSQGEPPPDAQPIGLVAVEDNGWYLLGLLPLAPVKLETCTERMIARAKTMRADGVSNLRLEYEPPKFFRLLPFGLPDWSARIGLTGMAYQLPEPVPARPLR
ncbi:MAG: hypothetical protein KDB80_13635 [Planctomycetes bacterium]|nr:hypothetical protein [Planctomycetota bacterium]